MRIILAACAATLATAAIGIAVAPAPAAPAPAGRIITVHMKDMGAEGAMVFEPGFVKANVGDTIRFVPQNAMHNAETIASILPAGVAPSAGGMGKQFDLIALIGLILLIAMMATRIESVPSRTAALEPPPERIGKKRL